MYLSSYYILFLTPSRRICSLLFYHWFIFQRSPPDGIPLELFGGFFNYSWLKATANFFLQSWVYQGCLTIKEPQTCHLFDFRNARQIFTVVISKGGAGPEDTKNPLSVLYE